MMGASALTEPSPVIIPTFSAPNSWQSEKNFSDTRALIGAVYQHRLLLVRASKCAAVATKDFPDPVGVVKMTCCPPKNSSTASSWAGYKSISESSAHFKKPSRRPSSSDLVGRYLLNDGFVTMAVIA